MSHHTKDKGDLAVIKTILDLTEKGFTVFSPTVSEHSPVDLIAYKNDCVRIQVKYGTEGVIRHKTHWSSKDKCHTKEYSKEDFDYYAIYLPKIDKVVYPSIEFGGATIRSEIPCTITPFYWWEDFINFTNKAKRKTYKDFGLEITHKSKGVKKIERRKVERPSAEELYKLLWSMPTIKIAEQFGVSDVAIAKWAKTYNINKPPRGYWAKVQAGKI